MSAKEKELIRQEYRQLVETAEGKGDSRLAMLVQTICATGIRVSEVRDVTVESRRAEIRCKGRIRDILLPRKLCGLLAAYCKSREYMQLACS